MYLDSAIIVKLLVREPDSDWFNEQLAGQKFQTSELALTEVPAALLAKERAGQLPHLNAVTNRIRFEEMVADEHIVLLPLNRAVLQRAANIIQACHPRVPLRTLDALHVATCDLHNCAPLCATDNRMRAACAHLGLPVFPVRPEDVTIL
jgi:predicted nucleic acid-binding protein